MFRNRPTGSRYAALQYALAVAAIWAAVGFGLWSQTHPLAQTNQVLLALQPANATCDPS